VIAAVVQARMSSNRLPGKVLRPIAGKPMLEYLLERLDRAEGLDLVVVATSTEGSDDPIEEYCRQRGAEVHRGPLENVAERFAEVVERFGLDAFARLTADSPLVDQRIVSQEVEIFRSDGFDLVTNVFPRSTFPAGQSVELVSAEAFAAALPRMDHPDHFEHVTAFFYRNPDGFKIENFTASSDHGDLDMSIDTEEDAEIVEGMISRMTRPHWEYTSDELVKLYREVAG
jgi:spore coat polysaccharide biosynthesis protein SpsF